MYNCMTLLIDYRAANVGECRLHTLHTFILNTFFSSFFFCFPMIRVDFRFDARSIKCKANAKLYARYSVAHSFECIKCIVCGCGIGISQYALYGKCEIKKIKKQKKNAQLEFHARDVGQLSQHLHIKCASMTDRKFTRTWHTVIGCIIAPRTKCGWFRFPQIAERKTATLVFIALARPIEMPIILRRTHCLFIASKKKNLIDCSADSQPTPNRV